MKTVVLALPLALLCLLAATAASLSAAPNGDLTVCPAGPPQCEYTTIQSALDAAVAGDRVLVAPGVYTGQLTLKSGVVLSSTAGAEVTTVRAHQGPIVTGDGVVSATIRGITISGQGTMTGTVGIALQDSDVRLADVVVSEFRGKEGEPGAPNGGAALAIRVGGPTRLTLDGVLIQQVRGGDGLAGVEGGTRGGSAIGVLVVSTGEVTIRRTTIKQVTGGAAGGYSTFPYNCTGSGGAASGIQIAGPVRLTVTDSQVTGLTGGAGCSGVAPNCRYGGGSFTGISASGGSVDVRDSRFEGSSAPASQGGTFGYGILTAHTQSTRLERNVITDLKVAGLQVADVQVAGGWTAAAASASAPDSPYCPEPHGTMVGIGSYDDRQLIATGNTLTGLTGAGPGGKAIGIAADSTRDVLAVQNWVTDLTGGYAETTVWGLKLTWGAAVVQCNTVTGLRGSDAPSDIYYADPGYDGGGAVGIQVSGWSTAAEIVANNVVASVTGGDAANGMVFNTSRNGGDAVALLVDGAARVWNNTCYRTVAGRGGVGQTQGQPGTGAGLWVTGDAAVRAGNNIFAQHAVGILAASGAAVQLANNDLWSNGVDYAGATPGADDVHVAPGFLDASRYDFHLRPDSALIDAGANAGAPATDNDGEPRPQDGNGDKVAVADIGADEYWPGVHAAMTVDPSVAHPGDVLTYRVDVWLSASPYFAAAVEMTDLLPPSLTYVPGSLSASSGTATEAGGTIHWSGSVSTGGPVVLTFQARVGDAPGPRSIVNMAVLNDGTSIPAKVGARVWIDPRATYFPVTVASE